MRFETVRKIKPENLKQRNKQMELNVACSLKLARNEKFSFMKCRNF